MAYSYSAPLAWFYSALDNACNIGADDHESHFVFDILFNNGTDIQPEIHSTDTHGTNEVNFALLYPFGYQFAPRYKDLCDKVRTSLTGFNHPSRYGDAIVKPTRKIREHDIVREWDECKRIFVSLALKETTQSTVVRKLSAHARNNRTKRALWEYDSIHRTGVKTTTSCDDLSPSPALASSASRPTMNTICGLSAAA
jgi:TnpA family transposase